MLRKHNKILIGNQGDLKYKLLQWHHTFPEGGHSGRDLTLKRLKALFTWKGLNKDVRRYVRKCKICQAAKSETVAKPGMLQPLPVPSEVWTDVSMDFITGLPTSMGKNVIMVVVDRFSKGAHFIPLSHPFTAVSVAQAYLDGVFKLHGWPKSIVSDRDAVFLSSFWQGLFSLHGTDLLLSSAYHLETDGQTEIVNKCLETYLRCMCGGNEKDWCKWLPLAEWWYNTHFHTASQLTPYEIMYNQVPPLHLPYLAGESANVEVDRSMLRREQMIQVLRGHLLRAQDRMKSQINKHRTDRSFEVGDWVWLKLHPYKQQSVQVRRNQKLAMKFYGPFLVQARIGQVAYKLKFPSDVKIHNVFHVSLLKAYHGKVPFTVQTPEWFLEQSASDMVPQAILAHRSIKFQNVAQVQYLVQWKDVPEYEATWEVAADFVTKFPDFPPYTLKGV